MVVEWRSIEEKCLMAEREGFEPSMSFTPYALSRGAPSATRPSLQNGRNNSTHEEKWQG